MATYDTDAPPQPVASAFRGSARHAQIMLVASTFLWGMSFPLTRYWQLHTADFEGGPVITSLTLLALRTPIALLIFLIFQPHLFTRPTARAFGAGLFLGFLNFLGCFAQVLGLAWATPSLSGFITSLASAWVPLLAFFLFRLSIAPTTLIGIGVGIAGVAFLEMDSNATWSLDIGAALTLAASFCFAFVILLLDRFGKNTESAHLTVGFVAMTGLPAMVLAPAWAQRTCGLAQWLDWLTLIFRNQGLVLNVLALAVFCTVLAYHWMTSYQPRVPASRAALIYLLEPLWAAGFSIACGYDLLTRFLVLGGGLTLGGNLLVELPLWFRGRSKVE